MSETGYVVQYEDGKFFTDGVRDKTSKISKALVYSSMKRAFDRSDLLNSHGYDTKVRTVMVNIGDVVVEQEIEIIKKQTRPKKVQNIWNIDQEFCEAFREEAEREIKTTGWTIRMAQRHGLEPSEIRFIVREKLKINDRFFPRQVLHRESQC